MSKLLEWVPIVLLVGFAAGLFGINFLLYRRWWTRNYFNIAVISASAVIIYLIIYSIAAADLNEAVIKEIYGACSLIIFACMQAAFFYFFNPSKRKELYIHAASIGLALIGLILLIFNGTLGSLVIGITALAYTVGGVKFVGPLLPKTNLFQMSYILFGLSVLFFMVDLLFSLQIVNFLGLLLQAAAYFLLLLIFYDRIVDMVETASYTAVTDGLTGLYNKVYFIKKVKQYIKEENARALIFVDIDNFKQINTVHGHLLADQILKLVASTLKDVCKDVGLAGRYGGEEMVAVITNHRVDPGTLSETFRALVEELTPNITAVTVSVGYSIYQDDITAEEFIKEADEAMYKAKNRGKNQVVSYQID
jgi:two-component system cell cycle response regulator